MRFTELAFKSHNHNATLGAVYLHRMRAAGMKTIIYLKVIHLFGETRLAFNLKQQPNLATQLQNIKGWRWCEINGLSLFTTIILNIYNKNLGAS
jgi:hypothetical protein